MRRFIAALAFTTVPPKAAASTPASAGHYAVDATAAAGLCISRAATIFMPGGLHRRGGARYCHLEGAAKADKLRGGIFDWRFKMLAGAEICDAYAGHCRRRFATKRAFKIRDAR